MKPAVLSLLLFTVSALAQDQNGAVAGLVVDSTSKQPVKNAIVSLLLTNALRGRPVSGTQTAATDLRGAFSFADLAPGRYQITVSDSSYPLSRTGPIRKTIQVNAGQSTTSVTFELTAGAVVTGHIFDEDGDPLNGCLVQAHPAATVNQIAAMSRSPTDREDGSFRVYNIAPGKYFISAQCPAAAFEPRPLSEGADPPPRSAYPADYYPGASDIKSAQIVELFAGAEKSGVDFRMRPVPVTQIHGTLVAGTADWRGRANLQVQLVPIDTPGPRVFSTSTGARLEDDGSFEFRRVFPGAYVIVAFSLNLVQGATGMGSTLRSPAGPSTDANDRVGGTLHIDATETPLQVTLQIHRAVDIPGNLQMEQAPNVNKPVKPDQIVLQLLPEHPYGVPPSAVTPGADGSFVLKSVLPGEWRIKLIGQGAYLKSAVLGSEDVTGKILDLTSGSAAPLRLVASANLGSIAGSGTPGQRIVAWRIVDGAPPEIGSAALVEPTGQFSLRNLTPGKYRVATANPSSMMMDPPEGGLEVTLLEGETKVLDHIPPTSP